MMNETVAWVLIWVYGFPLVDEHDNPQLLDPDEEVPVNLL